MISGATYGGVCGVIDVLIRSDVRKTWYALNGSLKHN